MWTPISSTSRPAGAASRSDRPHWPCGSGSAIVKRKAGFGPEARPQSDHAALFLTARAPFRPISASALYHLVASRLPATEEDRRRKGRGPHGLRHACARHLIEAGLSFKEVGDHLGHRSPDSTQ